MKCICKGKMCILISHPSSPPMEIDYDSLWKHLKTPRNVRWCSRQETGGWWGRWWRTFSIWTVICVDHWDSPRAETHQKCGLRIVQLKFQRRESLLTPANSVLPAKHLVRHTWRVVGSLYWGLFHWEEFIHHVTRNNPGEAFRNKA